MSNWLAQFYLGMVGAWAGVTIYERLCLWWEEGKADLRVETLDHEDPRLAEYRRKE